MRLSTGNRGVPRGVPCPCRSTDGFVFDVNRSDVFVADVLARSVSC